jgi:death-on-curing protein
MELVYFDLKHAKEMHDKIIAISGGIQGVIDLGRLDSIIDQIKNDDYYPEFEDKLTHLVYSVNKGHCFNDGNKRTSIALGAFLLEVNGLDTFVNKFIIEMENIAVSVADNLISKELLREIVGSLLSEEEFDETLKLKIIAALQKKMSSDDDLDDSL